MRKLFSVVLILMIFNLYLGADVYIKQKSHTDAFSIMNQSQPAKDSFNHIWLGKDMMAMHGEDQSVIIDLSKKFMYMIDHKNKSYIEMSLPLNIADYFPEQMKQMQQMMGNVKISVTPTGEKKTIGSWKCNGYDASIGMMMMEMKMKIWATGDVPFDWKAYNEKILPEVMQATMRFGGEALKEFGKIKGYGVRTDVTMSMMGTDVKSYTEVLEISKKSAPSGTYNVPSGYAKKDAFSMEDMQRR